MTMDKKLVSEMEGRVGIVRVLESLDAEVSYVLEEELEAILDRKPDGFIVDLAETRLILNDGLRVLLAAARQARKTGTRLALCGLGSHERELLEISGLASLFEIYPTRAEALAALKR